MKKARMIPYQPKQTSAGTEYRQIDTDDLNWVLAQMMLWLTKMGQMDQSKNPDDQYVRDQWWHHSTKTLTVGRLGVNSPCSTTAGIVYNLTYKQPRQHDLTDRQCHDIEYISEIMGNAFEGCEPIKFHIGF